MVKIGYKHNNTSKINITKIGQVTTTIPKAIAGAISLNKGDSISWIFDRGEIIIRKVWQK